MLGIAAALLCGLSTAAAPDGPAPRAVTVTEKDDGKDVALHTGDELVVKLKAQPSTGSKWDAVRADKMALKSLGDPTIEELPGSTGEPGRVQVTVFRYQVLGPDPGKIRFEYARPFGDRTPTKTFSATLKVSAAASP